MRLAETLAVSSGELLLEPATDGPVKILGRLGEGGTSVVHHAESANGREFALKVLAPRSGADGRPYRGTSESMEASFLREGRILKHLDGTDGVPQMLWAGTVMRSGVRAPAFATSVLRPVNGFSLAACIGELRTVVQALHGLGVVHLDIKPGNVMADVGGSAVLIDFGSALTREDVERGGARLTSSRILVANTRFESWLDRSVPRDSWDELIGLDMHLIDRLETMS